MRFHVVSLPHTQTTKAFSVCAYTEKVRKFCNMMKSLGHTVYLYAGEQNEAACDELIPCITEEQRSRVVGDKPYVQAGFEPSLPHWVMFNTNVVHALKQRYQHKDFICVSSGRSHKMIDDAFPHPAHMVVENGIGYSGTFARYRVWESYAWMHACYGSQAKEPMQALGHFFDQVIPNSFEVEDFPFSAKKEDYFVFLGRLNADKGLEIAVQACQAENRELRIAGVGTPPTYGTYVGVVGPKARGKLLSKAKALLVPTLYIEPFGGVAVEAMMCGTPVITTDWGAFTETVQHGVTGFRCRMLRDFRKALTDVEKLDPRAIRKHAINTYSTKAIAPVYEAYFRRLETMWGVGWTAP